MRFDNLLAQIRAAESNDTLSLDSALCIMSMVAQDVLSNGSTMTELQVSNLRNLGAYLSRISSTLNRIYEKHESSIKNASGSSINPKLRSKLAEIEKTLAELEDQKCLEEKLLSQMQEKEVALNRLKAETVNLQNRLNDLQRADLNGLNRQKKTLEEQIKQTETALTLIQGQIRELEKDHERKLQEESSALRKKQELDSQKKQLDASLKDLANAEHELRRIQTALDENAREKAAALEEISSMQRKLEVCEQEKANCIQEAQKFRQDLERKEAARERAEKGRNEVRNKLESAQSEETHLLEETQTLQAQLKTVDGNIADHKANRDQLTEKLQEKKKENNDLVKTVAGLYNQIESLRIDNAGYREKYLAPAQENLRSEQDAHAQDEQEVRTLIQKLEEQKDARKAIGADVTTYKTMIEVAENDIEKVTKELEQKTQQLQNLRDLLGKKRQELNNKTQNEIEPVMREVERMQQLLRDLDVETVKKSYQQTLDDINQRITQTEGIRDSIPGLRKKLEEKNRELDSAKREYDELEAQRHRAEEEHNRYRLQLDKLIARKPAVQACENRLATMKLIQERLTAGLKRLDLDLGAETGLDAQIDIAEELLTQLRICICAYAEISFE